MHADLHLIHSSCRYAGQLVTLQQVSSPQDHLRSHARVTRHGDDGADPEDIVVDDPADRTRLEKYFQAGGGVVRLHCRGHGPYQQSTGLGPR
jgi:hypothetical protein